MSLRPTGPWLAALGLCLLVPTLFAQAPGPGLGLPTETTSTDGEAFDRTLEVNVTAIACPEGYDNHADDDVCLAYDGQIPGPTFVFEEGDTVQLTLNHSVADTIDGTNASPALADELVDQRYSLHRHGVSVAACEDGVAQPRGTEICDSTVGPPGAGEANGSVTYEFAAEFPGFWHYHDHSLGLGVNTTHGNHAGPEAEHRGLWGAFLVLPEGVAVDEANVFDLHLLDAGPNGGLGLNQTLEAGERFDLAVTGLGDEAWRFDLEAPDGTTVETLELGPGVSRGVTVESAQAGTYTWTARSSTQLGAVYEGTIEVVEP